MAQYLDITSAIKRGLILSGVPGFLGLFWQPLSAPCTLGCHFLRSPFVPPEAHSAFRIDWLDLHRTDQGAGARLQSILRDAMGLVVVIGVGLNTSSNVRTPAPGQSSQARARLAARGGRRGGEALSLCVRPHFFRYQLHLDTYSLLVHLLRSSCYPYLYLSSLARALLLFPRLICSLSLRLPSPHSRGLFGTRPMCFVVMPFEYMIPPHHIVRDFTCSLEKQGDSPLREVLVHSKGHEA